MANEENEVLTRFTAVDEQLQDVSERVNKTVGQVAEKHQQAHFSMRHAMALTASATGMHTAELMHFYYAVTMIPGPVGVAVGALLMFKSAADDAAKAYDEYGKMIQETDEKTNATFRQHVHATMGGERGEKGLQEYEKHQKDLADLRKKIDEEYGKSNIVAGAYNYFVHGPEVLAGMVAQYHKMAADTGIIAQNATNEVEMGEKDWEYTQQKFELERNLDQYSKNRVENLKKEEEILENQVMDQDEMNKKLGGADLDKGQKRFMDLAKQLKQMYQEHAEIQKKTQLETEKYRNQEIAAVQGPQMAAYYSLQEKMTRESAEARLRGQDKLADQMVSAGNAQMGKMGVDAQRELQSKQKIGFSGLADFWKSFNSKQMTPAEREHIAELRKIVAILSPFAAKVLKQREGYLQ